MNELKIFNNPDFGDIRTMMIEGEPWFVGKDVASSLGYAKPLGAIATHVSEDDSLKQGLTDALGRTQETIFINESGLYALIFSSKLESAKKFKKWVTSEVLPSIRKTGSYNTSVPMTIPEQIQLLAMGTVELTQKVDNLGKKVEYLEMDLPILPIEADKIIEAVKKKGVSCLGGKENNAYRDRSLRSKVYTDIYRELKRQFGVSSYKAIRRNQMDKVMEIINKYELPIFLKDEIDGENAQERMFS